MENDAPKQYPRKPRQQSRRPARYPRTSPLGGSTLRKMARTALARKILFLGGRIKRTKDSLKVLEAKAELQEEEEKTVSFLQADLTSDRDKVRGASLCYSFVSFNEPYATCPFYEKYGKRRVRTLLQLLKLNSISALTSLGSVLPHGVLSPAIIQTLEIEGAVGESMLSALKRWKTLELTLSVLIFWVENPSLTPSRAILEWANKLQLYEQKIMSVIHIADLPGGSTTPSTLFWKDHDFAESIDSLLRTKRVASTTKLQSRKRIR